GDPRRGGDGGGARVASDQIASSSRAACVKNSLCSRAWRMMVSIHRGQFSQLRVFELAERFSKDADLLWSPGNRGELRPLAPRLDDVVHILDPLCKVGAVIPALWSPR